MSVFQFELGAFARDRVTGFEGVIIGRVEYLTGCVQYSVAPKAKNNEFKESQWFDESRLMSQAAKGEANPGGPQSSPAPSK